MAGVVCFEFPSTELMTLYMDGFSTTKEGAIPRRTGHNFEFSFAEQHIKRGKATPEELAVYSHILALCPAAKYVVAWKRGDDLTRRHELQHARYATDDSFRHQVERLWNDVLSIRQREIIAAFLRQCGYPDEVFIDEFQAYYYTERPGFFGCQLQLS